MSGNLSRRGIFKGAVAGAVAVGWSQLAGGWVSGAHAANPGVNLLPPLDGVLETSADVLAGFSKDFGNLAVPSAPRAVLKPGSVQDIVKIIRFARANGLTVAMNGQSGSSSDDFESHSSYGQAAVPGGIAIDSRSLSEIHSVGSTSAVVGAGVTWAQLLEVALAQGKTVPALTDYLHLSVGGTISVGGIGGSVQKYGLSADLVEEIEIVTGEGKLLTASPYLRADLFNAAVAGGGQVGIITRARIKLVPAKTEALVINLFYDNLLTYLSDQERILADGRFSHQAGEIVRKPDDSGWRYKIEGVLYYSPPFVPNQAELLRGLRDDRASLAVVQMPYRDWIFRLDPIEGFLKENGFWNQPKPWLSLMLPASKTKIFVERLLTELTPGDLGVGFTGLYPFKTNKLKRPLFALPTPSEPVAYLFDILRFPFPGDPGIAGMMAQNRRLYDIGVSLGAKRYLVGAIPGMTRAQWRVHFGSNWDRLVDAKRCYDPDRVLTPGQGFFV
jgi:cytokinin dehydrogenase